MQYAIRDGSDWLEITGPFTVGDIRYPDNWAALATPEEREAVGILGIEEPGAQPTDEQVIGSTIVGEETPVRIWSTVPFDVAELKVRHKAQAEAYRDERVNQGCNTSAGFVQTDMESRLNVSGSVVMAQIIPGFSVAWRRSDDTMITLNAAQMAQMGVQVGQYVNACYAACFAIKDAIDAAETVEAVFGVDIEAGYP